VPIKRKTKDNDISATKSVLKCVLQTTTVRTSFAGLIICLKNLYALCYDLLTTKICNYFLSYKISQDHVEMFFALIRRMNGFTNNPTSIQFRSAYKKLLLNNMNVLVPATANCTPQDLTLMISDASNANEKSQENENTKQERVKSIKKKPSTNERQNQQIPVDTYLHNNYSLSAHDYGKHSNWVESEYSDDIIRHVAGSTVYSIKKKVHCTVCIGMLQSSSSIPSKLTLLKNRGGLHFASDDVYTICHCTEKIIRQYTDVLMSKNIYFIIVSKTLQIIPHSRVSS